MRQTDDKKAVRGRVREALCSLSEAAKLRESEAIWARVEALEVFAQAEVVALYWSLPDEPFTHAVVERWSGTKTVLLPSMEGDDIVFRRYEGPQSMSPGRFGIAEPRGERRMRPQDIDLIIVPGVAFCADGRRLGRGKGFYDRLLSKVRAADMGSVDIVQFPENLSTAAEVSNPSKHTCGAEMKCGDKARGAVTRQEQAAAKGLPAVVGVAFSCQLLPDVPCEEHDISLDMVISGGKQ